MKLLLVDGANVVMRCAYGGDNAPDVAVPSAVNMIRRAIVHAGCSHLVVALDYPAAPSWRRLEYDGYKASRTRDTAPWITALGAACLDIGWHVELAAGFEADDVIATLATRSFGRANVSILSSDSDLLPLTQLAGVVVVKPKTDGFDVVTAADVSAKYSIPAPKLLTDWKAMVGESGDDIPGVPGIGEKKASALIKRYGDLRQIIFAGKLGDCETSAKVATHEHAAMLALKLVTLRHDAPVPPIKPSTCSVRRRVAA